MVARAVPESCTLPTAVAPLRLAELDELLTTAVRDVTRPERDHLRLDLEPSPQVAARTADLMTREVDCCSFFTFRLTATGDGGLSLDVTVAPTHVEVLDAIAARAAAGPNPS